MANDLVFHIKLESGLSSLANRRGDIIQFTTLDDVKGTLSEDLYKESAKMDPATGTITYECARIGSVGDGYVLVPAKTALYGAVSSRKSRSPFWIGGKAKVYARLNETTLEVDESRYSPIFDNPEELENLEPCEKPDREPWRAYRKSREDAMDKRLAVVPSRPAQFANTRFCIKGRRAQIDWATAVLGPLVAGYETIVDANSDDEDDPEGLNIPRALTSAAILSKASGLSDVLSGTSATIPAGMIFRVKLVRLP
ncbi:MAG: hypothetical protein ABL984_05000 [Pyrinomonadaceae bacterium]